MPGFSEGWEPIFIINFEVQSFNTNPLARIYFHQCAQVLSLSLDACMVGQKLFPFTSKCFLPHLILTTNYHLSVKLPAKDLFFSLFLLPFGSFLFSKKFHYVPYMRDHSVSCLSSFLGSPELWSLRHRRS